MFKKLHKSIKNSPINFFSDLFIVAMVVFWIVDNVYESIIATIVTISSVILSFNCGYACYEVSMWSSIGTNIALPLSCGGALWMLKCGVQHAIANKSGKQAKMDFPKVDDTEIETEEIMAETTEIEGETILSELENKTKQELLEIADGYELKVGSDKTEEEIKNIILDHFKGLEI